MLGVAQRLLEAPGCGVAAGLFEAVLGGLELLRVGVDALFAAQALDQALRLGDDDLHLSLQELPLQRPVAPVAAACQ